MADIAIANVVAVIGKAYARNADGELREINPGDVLLEGETVVTPDGSRVELELTDGNPFIISDVEEMAITRDLMAETASSADESVVEDESVDAILAALESGEDLGDVLEATAAGGAAGGPGGEGSSFIRLGRIAEDTPEFHGLLPQYSTESTEPVTDPLQPVDAIDDFETSNGEPVVIAVKSNDIFLEGQEIIGFTPAANGTVEPNGDGTFTYTPNEGFSGTDTFTYTSQNPTGTATDTALVTIVVEQPGEPVEEPLPLISISDAVVQEGDTALVTISLSKPSDEVVTVKFDSFDGTATVVTGDYDPDTGIATFAPGQTEVVVSIATNVDDIEEGTEFLTVELTDPTGAEILDGTGVVEIIDNFTPPVIPSISINDVTVTEGQTAVVTVTLSEPTEETVTVSFTTADGSAVSGADYNPTTGALTFAPGQTAATVSVGTVDDDIEENTENLVVNLSGAANAVIAKPQGVVTIVDNDDPAPPPPPPPGALGIESGESTREEVYLPQGRTPEPTELSVVKTFTVTAQDGLATLSVTPNSGGAQANVFVNGSFVSGESVTEGPILLEFIDVTLTSVIGNGPGGVYTVTVRATLEGPFVHTGQGQDEIDLGVTVAIADVQGDAPAPATFSLTVVDDIPELTPDSDITESGLADGNVITGVGTISTGADIAGADGFSPAATVVGVSNTGQVTGDTGVGTAVLGSQGNGELILLADGSYTYKALETPANPSEPDVFYYTVEDGDGDFVTTTLTISLDGDPIITNLTPKIDGGDVVVDEDDLSPDGSDGSQSTTQPGTFNIAAGDGIDSLTVGGEDVIVDGSYVGGTVDIPSTLGTLTITGVAAGVVSYTFTLDAAQTHTGVGEDSLFEDFAVVLKDTDTGVANDTLTVQVVDDVPEAKDDQDRTESGVADGNVLTGSGGSDLNLTDGVADVSGADGLAATAVVGLSTADADVTDGTGIGGLGITTAKGTLVLNTDGSYVYTSNGTDASVGTDVFYYTIEDGDGDYDRAQITINLDSDPIITNLTPKIDGGDVVVDEDDLSPDGSDGSQSTTQPGTFNIAAGDGIDSLTVGGEDVIVDGSYVGGTVDIPSTLGTLTITGVAAGVVSYTFTLDAAQTHTGVGEDSLFEDFAVVLKDTDTGVANDTLTVQVVDDVPEAKDDQDRTESGVADGNVLTGSGGSDLNLTDGVADVSGADGLAATAVVGLSTADADVTDGTGIGGLGITTAKGTLVLNTDGSYVYTSNGTDASVGTDVFYYTIEDGDGDYDRAQITINLDSDPIITNLTPKIDGGDVVVDEDDLSPDGSDGSQSTTQPGTFNIAAGDGIDSLTVGGEDVIVDGSYVGGTVDIPSTLGTLTITGVAAGVVSYTFTLDAAQTHTGVGEDSLFEDFAVVLKDTDTGVANDTLTVQVVDDVPEAKDDQDRTESGVADGNVLTGSGGSDLNLTDGVADVSGADGLAATAVVGLSTADADVTDGTGIGGLGITTAKGTLVLNTDGSYVYTSNGTDASVGTDVFYYTIEDGDGDYDRAQITINLDSDPIITNLTPKIDGGDVVVDEDDLSPDGSDGSQSTTQPGTFNIAAGDGIDSLTVGGEDVIVDGSYVGGTVDIPSTLGTLTITGVAAGVVSYTFTLDAAQTHTGVGEDSLFEDFAVVLKDTDTGVANDTLTVQVVDDVPEAKDDQDRTESGVADGNVLTGSGGSDLNLTDGVADVSGADGLAATAVVGLSTADADVTDGTGIGGLGITTAKGTLVLNTDGSYVYTSNGTDASVGTDVFYYTIEDGDGDYDRAQITINLDSDPIITNLTPKIDGGDVVVDEDDLSPDGSDGSQSTTQPGTFNIAAGDGIDSLTVGGEDVIVDGSYVGGTVDIPSTLGTLTITGVAAGVVSYTFTLDAAQTHTGVGEDSLFEDFAVVLKDTDTGVANDTLTVQVVDDVPEAKDDQDRTESGVADGNVLTGSGGSDLNLTDGVADVSGADGLAATAVVGLSTADADVTDGTGIGGLGITTAKGTLVLNTDGSYVYTSNGTDASVGTDVFYYTIEDGDGDYDRAQITINLDSDPIITNLTPKIDGGDVVVDEDDLSPDGSDGSQSTTQPGTFNIAAGDGIDSLTVGGEDVIVDGSYVGGTVDIPSTLGTLTITGVAAGVVSYTFTLDAAQTHTGVGEDSLFEDFAVVLKDTDTGVANDTLTVQVVDDVPEAKDDQDRTESGVADGNVLTGSGGSDLNLTDGVADVSGADGLAATAVVGLSTADADVTDGTGIGGLGITTAKGTLVLNTDGSYVYTSNGTDASVGTDVFYYTIEDGDGDYDRAQITINLDSDPIITNLTPKIDGGDVVVDEDDLSPDGSDGSQSTTQPGTFNIAAGDGIDSLTVGGEDVIVDGSYVGGTVDIPSTLGTLTITGVAAGVVSYTFTLDAAQTHTGVGEDSLFEDFAVVLKDTDTGVANDTLTVQVVDDVPEAKDDQDRTESGVADGNVLTGSGGSDLNLTDGVADVSGADGLAATAVVGLSTADADVTDGTGIGGLGITTAKGTLVLNTDGSYVYTSNGTDASVGTDVFYYTIEDGDGDYDRAQITINLDSDPIITNLTPKIDGGDVVVDEDDLSPDGSDGSQSTTQPGTFNIAAGDGIDSLTVGGEDVIVDGSYVGGTVDIPSTLGTLTITGVAAGVVSYTFTLDAAQTHTGVGEDSLFEDFAVVLKDTDTGVANDTLTVQVVDDVPEAKDDQDRTESGVADGNVLTGSGGSDLNLTDGVADVSGADGLAATAVVGLSTADADVTDGTGIGGLGITTAKGTLVLNTDGSYVYTSNGTDASVGTDVFYYTIEDGDGDYDRAQITINLDSDPIITNLTPKIDGGDVVVDEDDLSPDGSDGSQSTTQPGTFNIAAGDGIDSLTVGGEDVIVDGSYVGGTVDIPSTLGTLTITGVAAGVVSYTFTLDAAQTHTGVGEDSLFEDFAVVLKDTDTGVANDTLTVQVVDDLPVLINPESAAMINVAGAEDLGNSLDLPDTNIDNNVGADQIGTIAFNAAQDGTDSGETSSGQSVYLYVSDDGEVIYGSTTVPGDLVDSNAPGNLVFKATLKPDGDFGLSDDRWDFELIQGIDGGASEFEVNDTDFTDTAGNKAWYGILSNDGTRPDLLVTPLKVVGGARTSYDKVNGDSDDLGVGNQQVNLNQAITVDFVTNLSGVAKGNYDENQDGGSNSNNAKHDFDAHRQVNGASAGFAINGAGKTTTVMITARDDNDADITVGDGDLDVEGITRVHVNGSIVFLEGEAPPADAGPYAVVFNVNGTVTVSGVGSADSVQVFTPSGYTSLEYSNVADEPFAIGGFGATQFIPGVAKELDFDLTLTDADGDTVDGSLHVDLEPQPDPTPDLSGGHFDADTFTGVTTTASGTISNVGVKKHEHRYDEEPPASRTVEYLYTDGSDGLKGKLADTSINDASSGVKDKAEVDNTSVFRLHVVNGHRNPGGDIEINGITYDAAEYGNNGEGMQLYTLNDAIASKYDNVVKLTSMSVSFDQGTIEKGGLRGSDTGKVQAGTDVATGEWRTGALSLWAVGVEATNAGDANATELDVSADSDGYDLVLGTGANGANGEIVGITNEAGNGGTNLLWEGTTFWHWTTKDYDYDDLTAGQWETAKTGKADDALPGDTPYPDANVEATYGAADNAPPATVLNIDESQFVDGIIASSGDDVFAFSLNESGIAPEDVVIRDFGDSGTDTLDLRDLLVGEDESDLSGHLNVTKLGDDTVIKVDSSGAGDFGAPDQTITLADVDLTAGIVDGGEGLQAAIINDMLSSGKLIVD